MFAYLQESERKAYNPKEFCRFYTMDQQPLNTAEQKDMQEFFTDLISKLEETSSPGLKDLIKRLFGGVITNLVISLDCPHVSCTLEEFYTIRCQVAGMKDLYDSLNEITVKDTLDGDNMYTCSRCARKVRAEKRACFRQLPQILCFNTMRYTFNMITMQKEKVNTHFSFPQVLNMSGYMEKKLMGEEVVVTGGNGGEEGSPPMSVGGSETGGGEETSGEEMEGFVYELIGVTVHTGTAEGGHYYSFIRERNQESSNKW
jgi:ubiquitin carboxyl-terminal hydrolase 34